MIDIYSFVPLRAPKILTLLVLGFLSTTPAPCQNAGLQKDVRPNALSAQLHRADIAYKSGAGLLEAKLRVDRVLKELPDDSEALKLRAKVFMSMKRFADALEDAKRAVAVKPEDGEAHLLVALCARELSSSDLASRSMDRAAGLLVDNAYAHVELSQLARRMGELDKAEAFARIAVALEPTQAVCQLELARAFVVQGKFNAAALVLQKAIDNGIVMRESVHADSLLIQMLAQIR